MSSLASTIRNYITRTHVYTPKRFVFEQRLVFECFLHLYESLYSLGAFDVILVESQPKLAYARKIIIEQALAQLKDHLTSIKLYHSENINVYGMEQYQIYYDLDKALFDNPRKCTIFTVPEPTPDYCEPPSYESEVETNERLSESESSDVKLLRRLLYGPKSVPLPSTLTSICGVWYLRGVKVDPEFLSHVSPLNNVDLSQKGFSFEI